MKRVVAILSLLSFLAFESRAQCEVYNGGFEEWIDLTDSFKTELGVNFTETIVLPDGWFSLFRVVELAFSGFILDYLENEPLEFPVFDAVKKYTPGANGTESAIRISGDTLLAEADLIQIATCNERPDRLTGYFKYEGTGADTLRIVAVLSNTDLADTTGAIGFAFFENIGIPEDVSRGVGDYIPFSVDFEYRSEDQADTVTFVILTSKDENNLSDTSYFVVDELKLETGSVATRDLNIAEAPFALTPNPASTVVRLGSQFTQNNRVQLFDALGKRVLEQNLVGGEGFSVEGLTNGTYVARLFSGDKVSWQKLIVSH